jgi:hypothetical protein
MWGATHPGFEERKPGGCLLLTSSLEKAMPRGPLRARYESPQLQRSVRTQKIWQGMGQLSWGLGGWRIATTLDILCVFKE